MINFFFKIGLEKGEGVCFYVRLTHFHASMHTDPSLQKASVSISLWE